MSSETPADRDNTSSDSGRARPRRALPDGETTDPEASSPSTPVRLEQRAGRARRLAEGDTGTAGTESGQSGSDDTAVRTNGSGQDSDWDWRLPDDDATRVHRAVRPEQPAEPQQSRGPQQSDGSQPSGGLTARSGATPVEAESEPTQTEPTQTDPTPTEPTPTHTGPTQAEPTQTGPAHQPADAGYPRRSRPAPAAQPSTDDAESGTSGDGTSGDQRSDEPADQGADTSAATAQAVPATAQDSAPAKPAAKSGTKPGGKPTGKPGAKAAGKPTADKPAGKAGAGKPGAGKAGAKPAAKKAAGKKAAGKRLPRKKMRVLQGIGRMENRPEIPDQSHLPPEQRTDLAVRVKNLHITYRTSFEKKPTLKQAITRFGRGQRAVREVEAIRDVSFEVRTGTAMGIIGANGAGKSTLMRAMAGILPPTKGTVEVWGRASTLLALGVGFNNSLSGRENIILGGLASGLSRAEVEERANEIAEWTELGDFIDMPMRTYSSGMFSRVAFSVAVHMEPDILMIDEALSTGDAHFREKANAKMTELRSRARAMFLVSHGLGSIREMCDEAIWIDKGRLMQRGDPAEVVEEYTNFLKVRRSATTYEDI